MKKVGCAHADRPSGKSSLEKHSWDTCWQWLMRIPKKALFCSLLGKLRKRFTSLFMKFLLYTWDSEHLVHTTIERHCCHLCFMGLCHASCTGSENHTPTLGFTHADPAALAAWRNRQQPSPRCVLRESPLWCHHCWTHTQRGTWHCPLIQSCLLFSSPLWRGLGLIVPRIHPNSYFLIASD